MTPEIPQADLPAPGRRPEPAEPLRRGHGLSRVLRAVLPYVLVAVLSIGAALIYELWQFAREPRWRHLQMDARVSSGRVEVTWDKTSSAVLKATRGILTVEDSGAIRDIEITPGQVRAGAFSYGSPFNHPGRRDVLFRLAIFGPGLQAAGDSVRLVSVTEPAPPTVAEAPAKPAPAPRPPKPAKPPETRTVARAALAEEPVATHEVQPTVSNGIRARIQEQIVVPVEVRVSATGKVMGAVAAGSANDGLSRYLAEQATAAARQWRFSPGRARDGHKVEAKKTLYFVFAGS